MRVGPIVTLSRELYEWAIFHVEQFFQLSLRFFLAEKPGHFPAIRGLERLFDEAGRVDERLAGFFERNRDGLKQLEEAYIGALLFDHSSAESKIRLEFLRVMGW